MINDRNSHDKIEKLIKFNMHAQYHCSVQACLFVRCWPRIFLVQCRLNFNNVGVAFTATRYYFKLNWSKIKITRKCPYGAQKTLHRIFFCTMFSGASQTILHVFPVQYCPRSFKTTLHRFFSCGMLSVAAQTTLHGVLTCAMLFQRY